MKNRLIYIMILLVPIFLLSGCATSNQSAPTSLANPQQASKLNVELGLRYLQQGNRERAKEKLLLAQQQYESAQSDAALAYFYEQTAETQQSELFYQKAIHFDPKAGASHNNYGAFLCRQKRYSEADNEFNRAVSDPNYLNTAGAYENAGICALMIPDAKAAANYFIKALQHNPNMPTSLGEMVQLSYDAEQYTAANDYLNRYLAIAKPSTELLVLAVSISQKLSNPSAAQKYQTMLKQINTKTSQE